MLVAVLRRSWAKTFIRCATSAALSSIVKKQFLATDFTDCTDKIKSQNVKNKITNQNSKSNFSHRFHRLRRGLLSGETRASLHVMLRLPSAIGGLGMPCNDKEYLC